MKKLVVAAALVAGIVSVAGIAGAQAQNYPTKQITCLVG